MSFTGGSDDTARKAIEVAHFVLVRIARPSTFYCRIMFQRFQEAFSVLEKCNVPVIVAVSGYCIGAGTCFRMQFLRHIVTFVNALLR